MSKLVVYLTCSYKTRIKIKLSMKYVKTSTIYKAIIFHKKHKRNSRRVVYFSAPRIQVYLINEIYMAGLVKSGMYCLKGEPIRIHFLAVSLRLFFFKLKRSFQCRMLNVLHMNKYKTLSNKKFCEPKISKGSVRVQGTCM